MVHSVPDLKAKITIHEIVWGVKLVEGCLYQNFPYFIFGGTEKCFNKSPMKLKGKLIHKNVCTALLYVFLLKVDARWSLVFGHYSQHRSELDLDLQMVNINFLYERMTIFLSLFVFLFLPLSSFYGYPTLLFLLIFFTFYFFSFSLFVHLAFLK